MWTGRAWQSTSPPIDSTNTDTNDNSAVDISGNVITMSGTLEANDTFGATINGVEISITATASDAYTDDFSWFECSVSRKNQQ